MIEIIVRKIVVGFPIENNNKIKEKSSFYYLTNIIMRLQRNWTSATTVRVQTNGADITLQPWNVIDVPQAVYQGFKDAYWPYMVDIGNDTQQQMVVKSFTAAQVCALGTTPVALIPAPWAGYAVVVDRVVSSLKYGSAAFATNTDMELHYDSTAGDAGGAECTMDSLDAILLLTADAVYTTPWLGAWLDTALTINKWVSVKIAIGAATGGTASTLKLRVYYRIVSVS